MASENVEALVEVYGGWERGDFTAGLEVLEPSAILVIDPGIRVIRLESILREEAALEAVGLSE